MKVAAQSIVDSVKCLAWLAKMEHAGVYGLLIVC